MPDTWTGTVDAKLESGQPTGFGVEKGDIITIVASGWAERGPGKAFGPQGDQVFKPKGLTCPEALVGALLVKIGDQIFPVNSGVFRWEVPASGELVFLFNDAPGTYDNNSGSFNVSVEREGDTMEGDMSNVQTGIIELDAPGRPVTKGGDASSFTAVTFPKSFPDGSRVIVIPMTQTFNGGDTPGLRIHDVTTKGFRIRMNEVVHSGQTVVSDGGHTKEAIGWAAYTV